GLDARVHRVAGAARGRQATPAADDARQLHRAGGTAGAGNLSASATTAAMIEVHATAKQFLGMPPARFLRDYWQKQPLLVRNAFPGLESPLQPEDLAGLACEDGVLARLVEHDKINDAWRVR